MISFGFYAWAGPSLLLILLSSIILNYSGGLFLRFVGEWNPRYKSAVVGFIVTLNLLGLGYFKYFDFLTRVFSTITGLNLPLQNIAFVLGISFFTFSGISYILDLNSGRIEVEKNPFKFALYMSFFPKLIQGPISRYQEINPQITQGQSTKEKFASGVTRFVMGLTKKVIIADPLGVMVNQIYTSPAANLPVSVAWLGAVAFTLQIYFDFSGYTDMAIGLGKMFGFELDENFSFPYVATSLAEFWRRWHITLSSWFRDYVFYPLERKNRRERIFSQGINILIVFFLIGLWHGAGWTFVVWGLWNGIVLVAETIFRSRNLKFHVPVFVKWIFTMLILISGWVIFRSPDVKYAREYLGIMFGIVKTVNGDISLVSLLDQKIAVIMTIGILASVPWKQVFEKIVRQLEGTVAGIIIQDLAFMSLSLVSFLTVISSSFQPFIYFNY